MTGTRVGRVAVLARAIHPWHGFGGLERHVNDLVRHLLRRNVGVVLITPPPTVQGDVPADPELADDRLEVRHVPYRTFPFAGRRGTTVLDRSTAYPLFGERAGRLAADLASAGAVDIVHGLGASALGYARRHRRGTSGSVPLVLNPQGLEEFGATDPTRARLKRLLYRPLQLAVVRCAGAADRVIATDEALRGTVERHLEIPPARIRVIPNALDLERCDAAATEADGRLQRDRAGIRPDEPVVLSVGRLEKNKGFTTLVEALARLDARSDAAIPWRWVIVGDGPYRRRIVHAIDAAGLRSKVVLLGRLPDRVLHAWYEVATLFVHPTWYEGSSLVTLEAMAHRRAVVATTAGGLPDKVRPGESGWLVPAGDAPALTQALAEALATPAALPAMGDAGRKLVERSFAWPSVIQRLLDLYDELLQA